MVLRKLSTFLTNRNLRHYSYQSSLDITHAVRDALKNREPVVALESTIITHGMPYPQNVETALEVENVVRQVGATPATIACIDGRLKVGLTHKDIVSLAKMNKKDVVKTSRRDLAYVVSNGKYGGTTVAATMIIAHMAGIKIFATGGVGGVHRNGHITMDVSADLMELGRTPITVVSSGVKSILDIPRTLEFLETQGVCVAALHSDDGIFPDFYTRDSGCASPYTLDSTKQAAKLINALNQLHMQSGILIAVPIPQEHAADKSLITEAIDRASKDAAEKGIMGKDVTPFLLAAVAKITGGSSLQANIALIKNNAKVAAEIACDLSNFEKNTANPEHGTLDHNKLIPKKPLIFGASMLDFCLTVHDDAPLTLDGATYHTHVKESPGGVGRNLAEAIYKLYGAVDFVSVIGNDLMGHSLLQLIPESVRSGIIVDKEKPTSMCSILFDRLGNCKMCLANMDIHKSITPTIIAQNEQLIKNTPLIIMDGNLSISAIQEILKLSIRHNKPVLFEPTDMLIAGKPFQLDPSITHPIRIITPNIFELKAIVEEMTGEQIVWDPNELLSSRDLLLKECRGLLQNIENKFDCILVTLGAHGVLINVRGSSFEQNLFDKSGIYKINKTSHFSTRFYAAPFVENIVNVSGAGDSFSSGFITGLLCGFSINDSISFGFAAAKVSLQSNSAIPEQYFECDINDFRNFTNKLNTIEFKDL